MDRCEDLSVLIQPEGISDDQSINYLYRSVSGVLHLDKFLKPATEAESSGCIRLDRSLQTSIISSSEMDGKVPGNGMFVCVESVFLFYFHLQRILRAPWGRCTT
jgi:hypothetical protein